MPKHLQDDPSCFCRPRAFICCPQDCETGSNCFKCGGKGMVPADSEFVTEDIPLIYIHHDEDSPEGCLHCQ